MNHIKTIIFCTAMALLLVLSGCRTPDVSGQAPPVEAEAALAASSEAIAEAYRDIYERALAAKTLSQPETIAAIAERIGHLGYSAADTENCSRFNMANWEEAESFCQKAMEGQSADTAIFCVTNDGGFVRFDLRSADGKITVNRSVLTWKNKMPTVSYQASYPAHCWSYTREGYLFFDEYQPEGYDGAPGYTAIRVLPLDETCRQLNQAFIAPVGYGANNMFLSDWTEEDFQGLDFNDLFPLLYPLVMKSPSPYETAFEKASYNVPESVFETVILSCFSIGQKALRERTDYDEKSRCYRYTARGFYDAAISPNQPYPEVVAYAENEDRTITLTVNAVLPKQQLSQAFCHEVVIRPMEDGSFQYVSNHVIPSLTRVEMSWYTENAEMS